MLFYMGGYMPVGDYSSDGMWVASAETNISQTENGIFKNQTNIDYKCGENAYWKFENDTLTIYGNGPMKDYNGIFDVPWHNLEKEIQKIIIEKNITHIGNYAFNRYINLQSITISDSVSSIGNYAFNGCTNLTSITIPDSVKGIGIYAFSGCNITSLTIPDSLTSIGNYTFSGCTNLTSIIISDSVGTIADYAFTGCTNLTSITIPDSVTSIGYGVFQNCNNIEVIKGYKNSVAEKYAKNNSIKFEYLEEKVTSTTTSTTEPTTTSSTAMTIKSEIIPSSTNTTSTTTIQITTTFTNTTEGEVFDTKPFLTGSCDNITWELYKNSQGSVNLVKFSGTGVMPKNIWYSDGSLAGANIEHIIVDEGITEINGSCATPLLKTIKLPSTLVGSINFSGCKYLTEIDIPYGVTKIESFASCESLEKLIIPDTVEFIGGKKENEGGAYESFSGCSKLKIIKLPNNKKFTRITEHSFWRCTSLESIEIPDSVVNIDDGAFYQCSQLKKIVLSKNLVKIGEAAFSECVSLQDIQLPSSLKYCGYAFNDCSSLTGLTFPSSCTTIPTSFSGCNSIEYVNVESDNSDCYSVNGVLYQRNGELIGDSLLYYPSNNKNESFVIPQNVKRVTSLGENNYIKTVVYPKSNNILADIGTELEGCSNLEAIYIPSNCSSISLQTGYVPSLLYIYGESGSYAEKWAAENGLIFIDGYPPLNETSISDTTTSTVVETITTETSTTTATITTTPTENAVYTLGDVNGDGIVDGRDATDVLTEYAKTSIGQESKYNEEQKKAADTNNDDVIDGRDATLILTFYAYISTGHSMSMAEYIAASANTK